MSETIVEVVTVEASTMVIDVIAPPPVAVVVDVADWGTVPITYPQLPLELQRLPLSFPVYGKPTVNTQVHVPIAFPIKIPEDLVGTQTYAKVAATRDSVFTLTAISDDVETDVGTVTFLAGQTTGAALASAGWSMAIGDVLRVTAPATQDPTLADVGITILTERE